jgi:hypothetical protein
MKAVILMGLFVVMVVSACAPGVVLPFTDQPQQVSNTPVGITVAPTMEPSITLLPPTPTTTVTPWFPLQGIGPSGFPANIDPLTGLEVVDANLLNRRTISIKVENMPRGRRPQWGLSKADIIYEYYTEWGETRFNAIYYGQNSEQVGQIRSGRYIDINIVQMYKSNFIFGYAWDPEWRAFVNSDFGNRLIVENACTYPALFRYGGAGNNRLLMVNLTLLPDVYSRCGIDNTRQNLDGMFFQLQTPGVSQSANQVFMKFSQVVYNRWDYDPSIGKYLRFEDIQNAETVESEAYEQLVDRNDNSPIAADNVVVLMVPYKIVFQTSETEVVDATILGIGDAFLMRDGQIYQVQWRRNSPSDVLTLIDANGNPFPFKPGTTWFEVLSTTTELNKTEEGIWRFTFHLR